MLCQIFGVKKNYFTFYKYFIAVENKHLKEDIVSKYLRKNFFYKYYVCVCLFYVQLQSLFLSLP